MYSVFCSYMYIRFSYCYMNRAVEGAEIKSARDWGGKETAKGLVLRFIAHCFCKGSQHPSDTLAMIKGCFDSIWPHIVYCHQVIC